MSDTWERLALSAMVACALFVIFTAIFDWLHGATAAVVSLATWWLMDWRRARKQSARQTERTP